MAGLLTAICFFTLAPFANISLPRVPLFVGVYQSALVLCDLITAVFLFGQFGIAGSRPLVLLASAYLFSASMAVFHALSFPGLFSATGLLGSGPQTTAWLYFIWHLGFPGGVMAYAFISNNQGPWAFGHGGWPTAAAAGTATLLVAGAMLLLTTVGHAALPVIMRGDQDMAAKYIVAWITWLMTFAVLPVLWRRKPISALNLWLMIVIGAWLCDVALAAVFNSGRYSLGWYAGRIFGLFAASLLLAVLLLENSRLYRRLARAHTRERVQRQLLEERTAQLDQLNQSLEQRVRARTAALDRSIGELRRSREELQELGMLGTTAREQERTRLARELHDELDQSLCFLGMQLDWLKEQDTCRDAAVVATIERMRQVIDQTLTSTRRIQADLRPIVLDRLGFAAAVRWLAGTFEERHRIPCTLTMDPPQFELVEPYSTVLFRIMQESLANVARHAGASRVDVALSRSKNEVRLRVVDDGRGFDVEAPRMTGSFGLVGIRERVHFVSGRVVVESAPGRGTAIDASIPLTAENGREIEDDRSSEPKA